MTEELAQQKTAEHSAAGSKHVALTKAIQNANSKPIPTYDPTGCFPGDANGNYPPPQLEERQAFGLDRNSGRN